MRKFLILFLLFAAVLGLSAQEIPVADVYPKTGYLTEGASEVICLDSDLDYVYLIFEWDEGMDIQLYYTSFFSEEENGPVQLYREQALEMSIFLYLDLRVESVKGEGNWYCYVLSKEEAEEVGYYFEEY